MKSAKSRITAAGGQGSHEQETAAENENKVGFVLAWVFGVFFLMGGLFGEFTGIAALSFVAMGLVLLPPVEKLVHEKTEFVLTRKIKVGVIIGGFLLAMMFSDNHPPPDPPSQSDPHPGRHRSLG